MLPQHNVRQNGRFVPPNPLLPPRDRVTSYDDIYGDSEEDDYESDDSFIDDDGSEDPMQNKMISEVMK
jgi:hypothetical protein